MDEAGHNRLAAWLTRLDLAGCVTQFTSSTLVVEPAELHAVHRIRLALLVGLMSLPAVLVAPLVVAAAPAFLRRDLLTEVGTSGLWVTLVLLAGRPLLVPSRWRRYGVFALVVRLGLSMCCAVLVIDRWIGSPGVDGPGPDPDPALGGAASAIHVRAPIVWASGSPGMSWTHFVILVLLLIVVDFAVLAVVAAGRSRLPSTAFGVAPSDR